MKKLIDKIYDWTQSLKKIVSDKMPKYDKDKTDHYKFVRIFTWPIGIWAIPFPETGFKALSALLLLAILTELPTLIKHRFVRPILYDSVKDIIMAVFAAGLLWVYLLFELYLY